MSKAWPNFSALGKSAVENAARLRQAIGERAPGLGDSVSSESSPAKKPDNKSDQLIRLPREAAFKLKWFDGGDASALVEAHTREKLRLQSAITALKKELAKALGKEDGEALEEELLEQLAEAERQQRVDEGVASVLLLAARAQMDSRVKEQEEQLESLKAELQAAREASEAAQAVQERGQSGSGDPETHLSGTGGTDAGRGGGDRSQASGDDTASVPHEGEGEAGRQGGSTDAAAAAEREAELLRARREAAERAAELGRVSAVLEEREAELRRVVAAMGEREAELQRVMGVAEAHEAELAQLGRQITEREGEVRKLEAKLEEQAAELARVRAEAAEQREEVARARSESAERSAEAEEVRAVAARAVEEAEELRSQLRNQAAEMGELQQRLLHLEPAPCPGTPTFVQMRQPFRSLGSERRRGLSNCSSEDGGQDIMDHLEETAGPSEGTGDLDWRPGLADTSELGTSGTVGRGEHLTVRSNELFAQPGDASEEASPEKVIGLRHMDSHVGGHVGANAAQHDLSQHCNGWASSSDQLLVQPAVGASPTLSSERDASDALLGKLQQVEQERMQQQEEINRLSQQVMDLEKAVEVELEEKAALASQLEAARAELEEERRSSEQRLAELREYVERQSARNRERLQQAKDIVDTAEQNTARAQEAAQAEAARAEEALSRSSRLETELKDVRSEIRRLTADLKARERERERAEARASQAEAALAEARLRGASEAEKGGALSTALASQRKLADEREAQLKQQMREMESNLRNRISKLDHDNQDLRRSAARAGLETDALEKKVAELEAVNVALQCDLREAELAAGDRDELAARVQALEERLQETRTQHEVLSTYKQIAAEQEAEKIKAQEEVVATARVATALEQRLREATAARDHAQEAAVVAQRRVQEAEESIKREVKRRLDAIGGDEQQWPRAAREEVARLNKHVEALTALKATVQKELDDVTHDWESELSAKASLEVRLSAAEQKYERERRESMDAIAKLERALSVAKAEVAEWRREASALGAERDQLQASLRRPRSAPSARPGMSPPPARRGGGGLLGTVDEETAMLGQREEIKGVDIIYFKNVMLKFLEANSAGRTDQCDILLPAVATLLKADPEEYRRIKRSIAGQPVHAINNFARGWLSPA